MAYQPMDPYVPVTDFSDDEATQQGGRSTVDTSGLDAEFSALQTLTDSIKNNMEIMQRSDGFITDKFIHPFSLAPSTLVLMGDINPVGDWVTATEYQVKDVVDENSVTYLCAEDHTSGVFATDLAAGKWLRLTAEITGLDVTTKGDLQGHDASSSIRLPVGANGTILGADSAAGEGISWNAGVSPDTSLITDGTFHIVSASAGVVAPSPGIAEELVIEGVGTVPGITFLGPTVDTFPGLVWNSPSGDIGSILYGLNSNQFQFYINSNATADVTLGDVGDGFIFNIQNKDTDLVVKGTVSDALLFVDAGNNRAGVSAGASSLITDELFHIVSGSAGTIAAIAGYDVVIESATTAGFSLLGADASAHGMIVGSETSGNAHGSFTYTPSLDLWFLAADDVEILRMSNSSGFNWNQTQALTQDFRIQSNLNTHMLFVDAGNNTVHIGNSLITGSSADNLVLANLGAIKWINNAGTTSANYGIGGDTGDNLNISVPNALDSIRFSFAGIQKGRFIEENSGGGLIFKDESSADHSAAPANSLVIYTKDVGGQTQIACRNDTDIRLLAPILETAIATTSGTAHTFSSLPAGIRKIIISFDGVSLSGTDNILVQIGDSGGIETSGYASTCVATDGDSTGGANTSSTAGFIMINGATGVSQTGTMTLTRMDGSGLWVSSHTSRITGSFVIFGGGTKTLTTELELDRVSITRTGTDTFDAGSVNILYE